MINSEKVGSIMRTVYMVQSANLTFQSGQLTVKCNEKCWMMNNKLHFTSYIW